MEYRRLGRSGLKVSAVGIGCNNFGRQVDAAAATAIVDQALECGINFFDTADSYGGGGGSEDALGRALQGRRHEAVIATKGGAKVGGGPNDVGGSRAHLMAALEASLRRLRTDYVDLYQLHRPDPATPIEETLRALDDMVRQGKVRYLGCCNFTAWQIVEANLTAELRGLQGFVSAQNQYNLLKRDVEPEVGAVCGAYGLGMLPFYPLASGLLTGKYGRDEPPPPGSRLSLGIAMYRGVLAEADFDKIARLEAFARERGHTLLELAMSWLAAKPFVASIIAGATRPEQAAQNAAAWTWRLSQQDLAAIDAITGVPFDSSGSIRP